MVTISQARPGTAFGMRLRAVALSLRRFWEEGGRLERTAYLLGALLFASGALHLAILVASGGSWTGPVSLRKPATFGLSFGLTLVTIAWATSFLSLRRRLQHILLGAFAAISVVEVALITLQAWRRRPSHFNFETPFDAAVGGALAFGGFVIVATVGAWTIAAFRAVANTAPSMRLALRFGFVALLGALGVGAAMIAAGSVKAQVDPQLAYATAGFLKPAHGVLMHAILVIPALAWLLTFTRFAERQRLHIVWLGVAGYLLLGAVVLIESIARISPLAAPAPATAASLLGVAALAVAGGIALYGLVRATVRHG